MAELQSRRHRKSNDLVWRDKPAKRRRILILHCGISVLFTPQLCCNSAELPRRNGAQQRVMRRRQRESKNAQLSVMRAVVVCYV